MAFTSALPTWNKSGVAPSTTKQNAGWGVEEHPPAEWFNWQWNTTYLSLQELQQNAIHRDGSTVFTGQIKSSLAQGTAPLVVASSTVVTNLNADKVDGYDATTTNTASAIVVRDSNGIIQASRGYFLAAQGTTPLQITSTTLVVNLNADLLDGFHASTATAASAIVVRDANQDVFFRRATLTATTGTAPFSVSSTTLVTNLNADMADGFHFDQDVRTGASPSFISATFTVAAGTAPFAVTSDTQVDNLNAEMVGGSRPSAAGNANTLAMRDAQGDLTARRFIANVPQGNAPFAVASNTVVTNLNADKVDGYDFNQALLTTSSPTFALVTAPRFVSTQATGTAPFTVASTTLVTNLNADMLDGMHTSSAMAVNTVVSRDGNGDIAGRQLTSTIATGARPLNITSTTLVDNLNADMVDGYQASTTSAANTVVVQDATQAINIGASFTRRGSSAGGQVHQGMYSSADAAGLRWGVGMAAAETGTGNVGADYSIWAYDDNGAGLGQAMKITRAGLGVAFSGAVTAPRFISSQANGTAPFTVASNTLVANLNADMLDGIHVGNLMRSEIVTPTANLNDITTSGVYRMQASGMSGLPGTGYYYAQTLVLRGAATDTIAQLIFPYIKANGPMYRRGNPTEAGGTGSYSPWYKFWTEENMGAGSGLDADTADGFHFNQDVRTTAAPSFWGMTVGGGSGSTFLLDQTNLNYTLPTTGTGSYARGFYFQSQDRATSFGGMGILGNSVSGAATINNLYMAHGSSPWSSGLGIYVLPSGNTGVKETSPSEALHVNGNFMLSHATAPQFKIQERDQGTDEKNWAILADAKAIRFRALNDAQSAYTEPLVIQRGTGTTITGVSLSATNITLTTGSTTVQSAGDAILYLNNTTGAANAKVGYVSYYNGLLKFGTANDAGLGSNHLTISNTGVIAVSNSTVASNLNADMLDGLHADTSSLANSIAARDAGANILANVFRSTVATGTAPFIVASTTVVSNLNVDMLDGVHANAASVASTIPVRDTNKKIAEVAANRIVVREAALGTTNATVATFTAPTTSMYTVKLMVRVDATPSAGISINVNYTGPGGTKSESVISSQYLQTGDWTFIPVELVANAGSAINIVAAASQTNSAWVSAVITEEG